MENTLVEVEDGRFVLNDVPGEFTTNAARLIAEAMREHKSNFNASVRSGEGVVAGERKKSACISEVVAKAGEVRLPL